FAASPPSEQLPKQCQVPRLGETEKDGAFSPWNGQQAVKFPCPAGFNWRYPPIMPAIFTEAYERMSLFVSSGILMGHLLSFGFFVEQILLVDPPLVCHQPPDNRIRRIESVMDNLCDPLIQTDV